MTIVIFRNVCTMAAIIAAYGVYTSPKETQVSNLTLANVEALARYELPEVTITCGETEGECWKPAELCMKVDDLNTVGGGEVIPPTLKQAILLTIGLYYGNREEVTSSQTHVLAQGALHLIQLYRDYSL